MDEWRWMTAAALGRGIGTGAIDPRALTDVFLAAIEAHPEAARIYAQAYGKDPDFYDFYRAMQSYDTTFAPDSKSTSTIILSPDNEYLKQFRGNR